MKMKVMIICPETNDAVWTGFTISLEEWDTTVIFDNFLLCRCGVCHRWSKEHAHLERCE